MLASREEVIHEENEEDLLEMEEEEGDVARQQGTEWSKEPFPHSRNDEGASEGVIRKQGRRRFRKTIKKFVSVRKKTKARSGTGADVVDLVSFEERHYDYDS